MGKYIKKELQQFITQSQMIHGDKYDYSLCEYNGCHTLVTIICPTHGKFELLPSQHNTKKAVGCQQCSITSKHRHNFETFLSKSTVIHNNYYSYDRVQYVDMNTPVTIVCPLHGPFSMKPKNHYNQKCPKCSKMHLGGYSEQFFNNYPEVSNYPSWLYVGRVVDKVGNDYCKVGITRQKKVQNRHHGSIDKLGYTFVAIDSIQMPLKQAHCIEQKVLTAFANYKTFPNTRFTGWTECFDYKIINNVLDYVFEESKCYNEHC